MKKLVVSTLLLALALGGLTKSLGAADVAATSADTGPNRLVDGVSVADFQAIQVILLESAAAAKEIAIIDAQMIALRAQRTELNFKAAARDHPELTEKLRIVFEKQRERQTQEHAIAREATRLHKKKEKSRSNP